MSVIATVWALRFDHKHVTAHVALKASLNSALPFSTFTVSVNLNIAAAVVVASRLLQPT